MRRIGRNNEYLIDTVLNAAKARRFENDSILLSSAKIAPRTACDACGRGEKCSISDDMEAVYSKLTDADTIIVPTPVYFESVTAQVKALFDRSVLLRRQEFQLKSKLGSGMAVGGSRNDGQEKTIQVVQDWMHIHESVKLVFNS